jgi:transposase InsO family protein
MHAVLEKWEHDWNYIRPHEALRYLTPDEYLKKLQTTNLTAKEAIVLQT